MNSKSIEFKVDILWKSLVALAVFFAGKLSWSAWEGSQTQLKTLTELVSKMDIRLSIVEDRSFGNRDILLEAIQDIRSFYMKGGTSSK